MTVSKQALPMPPPTGNAAMDDYLPRLVQAMQRAIDDAADPAGVGTVVSNAVPVAAFDASTATLGDTRNVLGNLLAGLMERGSVING